MNADGLPEAGEMAEEIREMDLRLLAEAAVMLRPDQIRDDGAWQSRAGLGRALTDEEQERERLFVDSVRQQGVIEPLVVEKGIVDGVWLLVAGHRRLRAARQVAPDKLILCAVRRASADDESLDEQQRDALRRADNIAENVHREGLRQWQLCEAVTDFCRAHPELQHQAIAKMCSLTESQVSRFHVFRERVCPELWEVFRRHGSSMKVGFDRLFELVTDHGKTEQVAAYNKLLQEMRTGGKAGKRVRGREKRPGTVKLGRALAAAPVLPESADFRAGFKYAIRYALGLSRWKYEAAQKLASEMARDDELRALGKLDEEDSSAA